ncbi:hypothetical protein [Egicoccus sp. AB-alg2]|uniref:8-oxoguanine DNA glycosylase OGG fold protein n=1 Tax=Egicoccus sp. AB-alg2 TaxID=3242693 RepID=UPI00359CBB90
MASLEGIKDDDLQRLPRASEQRIPRRVDGWRAHLAEAGASPPVHRAVDQYAELTDRSRRRVRELLLEYQGAPQARTAIVFLWGGARGKNPSLAVIGNPRVRSGSGAPWLRAADDHRDAAHTFLWNPRIASDGIEQDSLVAPRAAFEKLWSHPNLSQGLLPGCGTAFGTKLLYWAARCELGFDVPPEHPIPLIYDLRVFESLRALGLAYPSDEGHPTAFTNPQRKMPFATYEAYCRIAYEWSNRLNERVANINHEGLDAFVPDDVEVMLFAVNGVGLRTSQCTDEPATEGSDGGGPEIDEPQVDPSSTGDLDLAAAARVLNALAAAA